ncbi:hypothetical protein BaRGS_00026339 [Batillaria attramentaria]|uniref:RWD domain-containing protein n=1 Tax=Batillaria attramentaria TaxID=370345 RepID=A0ABD0K6I2_9CAEN
MAAANESGIDEEGVLSEEIGVLESIYITELTVIKDADGWPGKISVLLHPATGDDDSKKYVCMTLVFTIPHTYPNDIPEINVQHPRGLGEEELHSLIEDMKVLAEEMKGGAMLFELIEMAKDCLTEGNLPHCECAICLDHFEEGDAFIKTDCYHYFHRPCLARYAAAFVAKMQEEEEQAVSHTAEKEEQSRALACPMCRLPLSLDLGELLAEPVPPEELVQFTPTDELLQQQAAMAERYEQQKAKGGIIDLEEEKNKFLVSEDTVVSLENVRKPPQDPSDGKADVSNVTTHKTKNRKPLSVHAHRDGPGLAGAGRGAHLDNIIKAYSSPQRNRDNVAYKNDRRQNSRHPAGRHRCGDDEIHSEVGPRHKTGNPRSTAHPGLVQGRTHPARHKKVHEDDGSHSSEEEDEKSFEKDADDFADNWQMETQKPERPKLQGLNSRDSGSQEDGSSKKPCPHKHPHKASNAPLGDGYSHARHLGTHNKKAGESARPKLQRHDNKDLDTQGAEHHPHKTHTRPHQPVRHLGQAKKESYNHKKDDATVVQRADSKQSDTTEEDHQIKKLDHPKPAPFLRKVSVTKPGAQDTHKEIHSSKDDAVPAGEKNRYSHTAYDDSHHAGNKHNWAHDWSKHVREEKRWHGQHADSKRGGHQRHAQRSHAQDHDVLHKEEDWDKEIKKAKEENKKSDSGRKSNHPDIQSKSDGNELHKVAKGYAGKHVKEDEEAEARIARRALSDVVDLGEPHRHPRPSRPQRVMQQDMHSEQRSDHGPTHVATHMRSKKAEAREEDDWEKEASLAREKLAGSSNPTEGGKDGDTTHHIKNKHKGDTGHFHTKAHGTRKKLAAHKADKGREDLEAEAVERTQTSQNPPEKDKDSLHHEKEVNSAVAGSGEIPSQHIPGSGHKPAVLSANKPRHRGKERCPPGFRIGPPPGFDTNTKAVLAALRAAAIGNQCKTGDDCSQFECCLHPGTCQPMGDGGDRCDPHDPYAPSKPKTMVTRFQFCPCRLGYFCGYTTALVGLTVAAVGDKCETGDDCGHNECCLHPGTCQRMGDVADSKSEFATVGVLFTTRQPYAWTKPLEMVTEFDRCPCEPGNFCAPIHSGASYGEH